MAKMARLGRMNTLSVQDKLDDGYALDCVYFDDDALNAQRYDHALLPFKQAEGSLNTGDTIEVFVYLDRNNKLVATCKTPLAFAGQCVDLEVVGINKFGAFLDWGLDDDLLLPVSEQAYPVKEGLKYVVYVHIDNQYGRIIASTKLHHFLDEQPGEAFSEGQQVDAMIATRSQLGYKAIIDNRFIGLIYHHEIGKPLRFGSHHTAWVSKIREDGKLDLTITKLNDKARESLDQQIIDFLNDNGGSADIGDKSSAFEISQLFNCSKNNFKKSLGRLYKQRVITLEPKRITLIKTN